MSFLQWLLTELELAGIADDVNGTRQEEDTLLKFNEMALFKPMEDLNVRIQLDDSRDWKIADMPFVCYQSALFVHFEPLLTCLTTAIR